MKKNIFSVLMLLLMNLAVCAQVKQNRDNLPIDLNIKLKRCVVSGNQGYIDLIVTNNTGYPISDVFVLPYNGNVKYSETVAYDDEGNVYFFKQNGNGIKEITVGGKGNGGLYSALPEEVPVKVRIELQGVSEFATEFTMLNMIFRGDLTPNKTQDGSVTFRNIPITRVE